MGRACAILLLAFGAQTYAKEFADKLVDRALGEEADLDSDLDETVMAKGDAPPAKSKGRAPPKKNSETGNLGFQFSLGNLQEQGGVTPEGGGAKNLPRGARYYEPKPTGIQLPKLKFGRGKPANALPQQVGFQRVNTIRTPILSAEENDAQTTSGTSFAILMMGFFVGMGVTCAAFRFRQQDSVLIS